MKVLKEKMLPGNNNSAKGLTWCGENSGFAI